MCVWLRETRVPTAIDPPPRCLDIFNVSNGPDESMNSRIKTIKIHTQGFRNRERFANAIYFYLGRLDLYPVGYRNRKTHLKSGRTS